MGDGWMRKKLLATLTAVALAGSLFTSATMAKSTNAKESLVALGDSIPFGYNLGVNNQHPSKDAFPFLIENDGKDFRVNNLGVPGWRSDQLLNALENDQKFRQAVRHADTITLSIGSNDLLQGLSKGDLNVAAIQVAAAKMLANLKTTITEIRSLTDAPIVVYNIYNPFQLDDPLHGLGATLLPGINTQISAVVGSFMDSTISVANAFTAFGTNQEIYVIQGDIHPTLAGQEVLANLAEEALD